MKQNIWWLGAALLLGACATTPPVPSSPSLDDIEATLAADIATLASDDFGGRFPGTPGGEMTQRWLVQRYAEIGLEPAVGPNENGAKEWLQPFTLVRRMPATEPGAAIGTATLGSRSIRFGEGLLGAYSGGDRLNLADVPMVGVGPEADALKPNSLANRALVLPAADLMARGGQLQRAAPKAVLITTADQQEYDRAARLFSRGRWQLSNDTGGFALLLLSPEDTAALGSLIAANADRHPDGLGLIDYDAILEGSITQDEEQIETANVVGLLPGTADDAGAVLVLAHWDHLGSECRAPEAADRICNGAVDNASGIAAMTEAVRLAALDGPLDRDVIVLATSAEELGLLGTEAFVADPVVPLPTIVAGFNIDTIAIAPRGEPVVILGAGETPLDYGITEVARSLGREVVPTDLQDQFLRRQDGWVFLREGVPTVMAGSTLADPEVFQAFLQGPYHGPNDEVGPGLELGGAAEDTLLHAALIRYFATLRTYPGGAD